MIYYPLSVLMEADIRDILVITTPEDQPGFKRLLGDGSQFGVNLSYVVQPSPDGLAQAFILGKEFIGDDSCAMVLGDNIFYGGGFRSALKRARQNAENGYATIFGYQVKNPEAFGIMEFDEDHNIIGVEEKPQHPKSDFAITGLYFYPQGVSARAETIKPSARGELEITDLNALYLKDHILKAELMVEGFIWFDTGTHQSMLQASNMISSIETQGDRIICCPEKIGYENGWLDDEKLAQAAESMKKNQYGQYLAKVLARKDRRQE
jgi:glucose-1-phosphate thymidylyltransferase